MFQARVLPPGTQTVRYLEVLIQASRAHPEIVGGHALIEFGHAKVVFGEPRR